MYFRTMDLVTGGTGLVGSHVLYQLALKKERIVAIYRSTSNRDNVLRVFNYFTDAQTAQALYTKIIWRVADITTVPELDNAFEGVTHVYHCAAVVSFDSSDYHLMRKVNIEGTANMVNIALSKNIKKFVHISSIATIEKKAGSDQITENNEWNNEKNNYGYAISKYGAEMEVWRAGQEGLNIAIVNPGVIFGSGFWQQGPNALIDKVYRGFKFYTKGVTGFVTANDVARAMLLLMDSAVTNERYILVNKNQSFQEMMHLFAKNLHTKAPRFHAKPWLTAIIWRLDAVKSFLTKKPTVISKHSAKVSHNKYCYDSSKIKQFGFKFSDFETEIKTICTNYLNDKNKI